MYKKSVMHVQSCCFAVLVAVVVLVAKATFNHEQFHWWKTTKLANHKGYTT